MNNTLKHSLLRSPFWLLLCLLVVPTLSHAQGRDSVMPPRHISPKSFIWPAAVVVASASAVLIPRWRWAADAEPQATRIEDYSQWAPMAAVMALGAVGVRGQHGFWDQSFMMATAFVGTGGSVYMLKRGIDEPRPWGEQGHAFPSGHAAFAFMGAEMMRLEYGQRSAWYGLAAYVVAGGTAVLRVQHGDHWLHDVVAGAGMGILCARIAYWLYPHLKKGFFMLPIVNKRSVGVAVQLKL